jgi:Cu/Ag efflux protein CusF
MKHRYRIVWCSVLLYACAAWAQPHQHVMSMPMGGTMTQGDSAAAPARAEGEVIKANPQNNTVTLKHGEIKNLNMPPMTMDYHVQDKALFARLKPGRKIHFTAGRVNGVYTVLTVEPGR